MRPVKAERVHFAKTTRWTPECQRYVQNIDFDNPPPDSFTVTSDRRKVTCALCLKVMSR